MAVRSRSVIVGTTPVLLNGSLGNVTSSSSVVATLPTATATVWIGGPDVTTQDGGKGFPMSPGGVVSGGAERNDEIYAVVDSGTQEVFVITFGAGA